MMIAWLMMMTWCDHMREDDHDSMGEDDDDDDGDSGLTIKVIN